MWAVNVSAFAQYQCKFMCLELISMCVHAFSLFMTAVQGVKLLICTDATRYNDF